MYVCTRAASCLVFGLALGAFVCVCVCVCVVSRVFVCVCGLGLGLGVGAFGCVFLPCVLELGAVV